MKCAFDGGAVICDKELREFQIHKSEKCILCKNHFPQVFSAKEWEEAKPLGSKAPEVVHKPVETVDNPKEGGSHEKKETTRKVLKHRK